MNCSEFLRRYSDYDDSLVPPAEADRFRAHMSECGACARYDRVLRKGRMLARQLPQLEPASGFVTSLRHRLWRESHRRPRPALAGPARLAPALAALTVALAASTALGLLADAAPGASSEAPTPFRRVASAPPVAPARPPAARTAEGLPTAAAAASTAPRAWTAERVDRPVASSYSPLITGMPAYRGARPRSAATIPTYSLD
jgi:anti-sigma factor RsiW